MEPIPTNTEEFITEAHHALHMVLCSIPDKDWNELYPSRYPPLMGPSRAAVAEDYGDIAAMDLGVAGVPAVPHRTSAIWDYVKWLAVAVTQHCWEHGVDAYNGKRCH